MITVPRAPDGTPLVDEQVVGEVLAKYPDLRMSYEEFLALDEDFHGDWLDGQVRLLGGETRLHQRAFGTVAFVLSLYASAKRLGELLPRFQMRPRPDLPSREVDLLFVRRESRGRVRELFVDGPADLVVVVVSDESRKLDHTDKLSEYERGGVREYWLVDPFLEAWRSTAWRTREGTSPSRRESRRSSAAACWPDWSSRWNGSGRTRCRTSVGSPGNGG